MRMPWNRGEDDSQPAAVSAWDDEPEGSEGGEGAGEPEPSLDDLDDEAKGIAQAYLERALANERQKYVGAAQEAGFDYTSDGRMALRDATKAQQFLPQQPVAAPPPAPAQPAAAAAPEPEDPQPDSYTEPDAYMEWRERQVERRLEKKFEERYEARLKAAEERNQHLSGIVQERVIASDASRAVRDAVEQYAPELLPSLAHPDFDAQFRATAANLAPELLATPQGLAMLAGIVRPNLDPARQPAPEQPRDAQGRYRSPEEERQAFYRQQLQQGSPREAGPARVREEEPMTREDQLVLEAVNRNLGRRVTREEWEAADEPRYDRNRNLIAERRSRTGRR